MNERIKQLAIEANLIHAEQSDISICYEGWNYSTDNLEKFAELIVKECAAEADKCAERGSWMAGYRIKQHFGVGR
jgi:hypothetical protein